MLNYIFSGIFLYLIIGIAIFIIQRRMTFNKSGKPYSPKEYGLYNIKEVFIETPDNLKLLAWFQKPKDKKSMLVYFHGNSFDIGERAYRIERYIKNGWGVLLVAWRGYSGNKGTPTEKNLYIDGQATIDWLKKNINLQNSDIVLYGESLGCGVAIELALQNEFKSIILEAPFTSMADIGQQRFPIYPVKYLTLDKFDNLSKIEKISSPLLIIHGKNDEIIPCSHSLKLFQKAKEPKKNVCVDEAMHNNLYDYNIGKEVINFNS